MGWLGCKIPARFERMDINQQLKKPRLQTNPSEKRIMIYFIELTSRNKCTINFNGLPNSFKKICQYCNIGCGFSQELTIT